VCCTGSTKACPWLFGCWRRAGMTNTYLVRTATRSASISAAALGAERALIHRRETTAPRLRSGPRDCSAPSSLQAPRSW
jgi:hypothetical protein